MAQYLFMVVKTMHYNFFGYFMKDHQIKPYDKTDLQNTFYLCMQFYML